MTSLAHINFNTPLHWTPARYGANLYGCFSTCKDSRKKNVLAIGSHNLTLHIISGGFRIFPRGRQPPRGCQHTILPNFLENCMKSKEFGRPGRGGGGLASSLDPPMNRNIRRFWQKCNNVQSFWPGFSKLFEVFGRNYKCASNLITQNWLLQLFIFFTIFCFFNIITILPCEQFFSVKTLTNWPFAKITLPFANHRCTSLTLLSQVKWLEPLTTIWR